MSAKLTNEAFISRARAVHGDTYDYRKVAYCNAHELIIIICPEHGEFEQRPCGHLNGYGCKACGTKRMVKSKIKNIDKFNEKANVVHKERYQYSKTVYVGSKTLIKIICPEHGEFEQIPNSHLNGHGCSKCTKQNSKAESELIIEFARFNPDQGRRILNGREIDIFFADYNLGIEMNGEFWHTEQWGRGKDYHLGKTILAQEKGINLLHFWDKEYKNKPEIVKSMIRSKLGGCERLHARKLVLAPVEKESEKLFFETNHIQGFIGSRIAYGLFDAGELVQCMSFGASRFDKSIQWELLRMASKCGVNVIGGASKILKHFEREQKPRDLISYADKRYSKGNAYEKLGFVLNRESAPSYHWQKDKLALPRYRAMKHKLPKLLGSEYVENETEAQNMQRGGFYKRWDCGQFVFIKDFVK